MLVIFIVAEWWFMHENHAPRLHMSGFYLKKFIVKVSLKAQETLFNPLLLLDHFFYSNVEHSSRPSFTGTTTGYDAQDERGPMMVVILEMMVVILQINNKVNIH